MKTPIDDVQALMPHTGEMMLLHQIIHYDETSLSVYAKVTHKHIFVCEGHLPSWAAMEFMAQGVAAWAGGVGQAAAEPVRLGFLLGTRKLLLHFDTLAVPATLFVTIKASLQDDNGFGVFDSELWLCDKQKKPVQLLAEAALNVYSPTEAVLNEMTIT